MEYVRTFFTAVGGRLLWLPGFVSGMAALVGLLKGLGMIWLPDISWWAIALFVVLPLSFWSIPALLVKVVKLERQIRPKLSVAEPNLEIRKDKIGRDMRSYSINVKNDCDIEITSCEIFANITDLNGARVFPEPAKLDTRSLAPIGGFRLLPGQEINFRIIHEDGVFFSSSCSSRCMG